MTKLMTKDKLKERAIHYASNYFLLHDIYFEHCLIRDRFFIETNHGFIVEITFDEIKERARLMLESEIEGLKQL
ncbi:MAG: hypothetical protein HRU18_03840 [Pseudoalteromonas sp.]|uniref:hypothetical protein n=1 Tax=Pseudoalteromonas sp. TaxID=53249 RepID=UPI001D783B84|nr:hypothetical protein [Pseudoalteromonas sp.]NRA77319.1 hypothetical protein [Pseudoalteromonas sp.]